MKLSIVAAAGFLMLVANLFALGLGVWVIVKVLQWTGVL